MKRVIAVVSCLLLAAGAFGQSVDLDSVELSELDLTKADLSEAQFYFAGPVDLLVRGVRYLGNEYAALLEYDGRGNVRVAVPSSGSASGLPHSLDLSEAEMSLVSDGIRISSVIADGYYFSGKLEPVSTTRLVVSPDIRIDGAAGTEDLSDDVASLREEVSTLRGQLAATESAQNRAEDDLDDAREEVASLERRLQEASRDDANPFEHIANVTRMNRSGFSGGSSLNGVWAVSGGRLNQSDSGELFAKYALPVRQNANELVYEFSGRGSVTGWSGYGVHFLASGSDHGDRYGYGQSYLVWVTRDPTNTQSEQTFVQLYRSYDDARMVQVASRTVSQPIDSPFDVTVYADRRDRSIVVGVNGRPVLTVEDVDFIRSGSEVVARTLGPATLDRLAVRTR